MSSDTVHVKQALLPCPFCGGPAINIADSLNAVEAPDQVACTFCAAMADASKWNTRATPTPSPAMLSREEIARIIEPTAFQVDPPRLKDSQTKQEMRDQALAKADAIFAALTSVDRAGQGFVMVPRDRLEAYRSFICGQWCDVDDGDDGGVHIAGCREIAAMLSASPKTHSEKAQA